MRILFIGNTNRKLSGQRYYRFDHRIHNGLIRNGHAVHFFCDREEAQGFIRSRSAKRKRVHEALLKVAKHFQPEMLLVSHTNIVTCDMLLDVRAMLPGIRMAQFSVDTFYSDSNRHGLKSRQPAVDATFSTTGGAILKEMAAGGSPYYFLPNITDANIDTGRAFESDALPYDVSCFLNGNDNEPADHRERIGYATGIADAIPGLTCCYRGFNGAPGVTGAEYIEKLSAAAMGLSLTRAQINGVLSTPEARYLTASTRLAHIMGNGSLAISQDIFGLEDLYTTDEMVFFYDLPDLIDKVRFYRDNPAERRRLAENGWKKAHGEFSSDVLMQYLVERTMGLPLSRPYAFPTE